MADRQHRILRTLNWQRMWNRGISAVTAVLISATLAVLPAVGADLPGAKDRTWSDTRPEVMLSIAPLYAWVPGAKGTVRVFGAEVDIDLTPTDIIKNLGTFLDVLDGYYVGSGEIRFRQFGLMYDVVVVDLLSAESIEEDIFRADADVGFSLTMATLLGSYRIYDDQAGHIDGLAGLRYSNVDLNIGATLNGIIGDNFQEGDEWVDPVFGVKGRLKVTETVHLSGWGLVGGFGAGSKILLDGFAAVGYQPSSWFNAYVGFRASHMDYENGTFRWDMTLYGPVAGIGIEF